MARRVGELGVNSGSDQQGTRSALDYTSQVICVPVLVNDSKYLGLTSEKPGAARAAKDIFNANAITAFCTESVFCSRLTVS